MLLLTAGMTLSSGCDRHQSATDKRQDGFGTHAVVPGQGYVFELQEGYAAEGGQAVAVRVNGSEVFFGHVTTNPLTGLAGRFTLLAAPERAELVVTILDQSGATAAMVEKTLERKNGAFVGIARSQQGLVMRQQERPFLYD